MSILTDTLATAVVASGAGFNFATANPDYFRVKDDSNLASDTIAYMGNAAGAGDSNAKNQLSFLDSFNTVPLSTRTTRTLVVKGWVQANMHSSAPAGSFCKAGLRYSVNSGGLYTTIVEVNNVTANTYQDNGGFVEYRIDLGAAQQFSSIRVEAYTEADSGVGGGTDNLSYARAFGTHGYVEDFESAVNLLTVRPASCVFSNTDNQSAVALVEDDPDNARDGVSGSFARGEGAFDGTLAGLTGHNYLTANYPAVPTGSGVAHAQLVYDWDSDHCSTTGNAVGTGSVCGAYCEWSEFTGQPYSRSGSADSFVEAVGTGPVSSTQARVTFLRDITTLFRTSDQVQQRMHNERLSTGSIGWGLVVHFKVYEMYMEIRVPASSAGPMAGWEPV